MLQTKIYRPKTRNDLVYRRGPSEKLNKAKNKKLILVSAPAGYGKTTLVSQWIEKNNRDATWYSLDNADNDPSTFLKYIIAGIQTIKKDYGESALKLLNSPNKAGTVSIASLMINDLLSLKKELYLVLDDFHVISHREVFEVVKYLLTHIPDHIHLIILTRSDPPLSTSRMRSQGQVLEIRMSDLSFTANEITTFFNKKLKLGLQKSDIYTLEAKTEGWIAGLQLAALSMHGITDKPAFIEALAGSNRYIMDYLIEEVLRNQPKEVQEFLLKTSMLKQISAPICDLILNRTDSQLILEQLERDNIFVLPLDTERKWYRYHHLFADLLKQRLSLEDKNIIEDLHKKAGKWFEDNEIYDLAIEHILANKDYKSSIDIIGNVVEDLWNQGNHASILNYGATLPDDIIKMNPEFCLYYSWILIASGETQKASPFLTKAENLVKTFLHQNNSSDGLPQPLDKDDQYYQKLYGKIAVAFAYLYSHEEHSEQMFHYCKMGLDNLPEDDPLWHSWVWFTYGLAYFSEGNLPKSQKSFNTAFNYAQKTANVYLMSTILSRLAETEQQLGFFQSAYDRCADLLGYISDLGYAEMTKIEWTYAPLYQIMGVTELGWAEFDKAYEHLRIAYNLSKKGNDIFFKIYVSVIYSIILNYQGDKEGEKIARELDDLVKGVSLPPFLTSFYISSKVYWLLEKNQVEQAKNFIESYGLNINQEINHAYEMAYVAYARLLIRQNKLDEAESLLNELHAFARVNNELDRMVELDIFYSELFELRGQKEKAIAYLMKALEMSAKENHLFNFVFWAEKLKDLLNEVYKIHATTRTNIPKKFINKLKLTIKNEEKRKKNKSVSDLSDRELETLVLLGEDISNQEIADQLFISVNTVKTRLKNIFLKLEVDNRRKAFAKAKEQGLI